MQCRRGRAVEECFHLPQHAGPGGGGKSRPAGKIAAAAEGRRTCEVLQRATEASCEHSYVGTALVCLSSLPPLPPHPPTSASVEGGACLRSRFLHRLFTKVSWGRINFATKRDGDTGPVQTSRTIYVKMLCAVLRWVDRFPGPRYTFLCFLTLLAHGSAPEGGC